MKRSQCTSNDLNASSSAPSVSSTLTMASTSGSYLDIMSAPKYFFWKGGT
eukprot:CAMPEP_0195105758 /NCGR_PEP_ID=MMETSP0448-20130528/77810_1 /TAXON_ID=66468 /ORGANISM="Heterocapsa triquestra, Strain CCMP 448" /LENGTH=49 /DNA_ID=CAMNT_0040141865 /DNA_START=12 /DNA_END=161 /DNA_ORIENTATION=-